MLDGERCLLGRQSAWPRPFFSALAGFVEAGETLEEAVRREVGEEAGVAVEDVRYVASQPWPFPAALMLGFTAVAAHEAIRVDQDEFEDARWFTRAEMRRQLHNFAARKGLSEVDLLAQALWPTVTFTDELRIDLDGKSARLFPAPGHSLDHIAYGFMRPNAISAWRRCTQHLSDAVVRNSTAPLLCGLRSSCCDPLF